MTADDRLTTTLIHHPYTAPAEFDAVPPGVFKASTVFFPDMAALRQRQWVDKSGYTYGLHGTPTTFTLEARLATLEGARHVLLAPSGLSAITLVDMACLAAGDTVLLPDNVYGPSRSFAAHELKAWGIAHRVYEPMDAASLAAALDASVRLVWLEAPGSVTLEFPDLPGLVRLIRAQAPQAVIALDNTWGAGIAFDAFDLGDGLAVDVTVHALTKYPSGGADVLMGSVACRDDALHARLAWCHSRLGLGVGANDAEAVLRALPSLKLRYDAQDAAGRRIAAWAQTRPEFVRVLHPATPGSPGHAHWAVLCRAAAGLVSVEVDPRHGRDAVDAFVDALRLWRIGWSWGGPVSLAVLYGLRGMRSEASAAGRGIIVRLCLGLESPDDLIADLEQALARTLAASTPASPLAQAL